MYLGLAAVLVVIWVWGYVYTPTGGPWIHALLGIAVLSVIWHFMKGRTTPPA